MVFVTGALGMEAIGGHFIHIGGADNPYYIASFLIEETLEIVGLTLFATTLLTNLQRTLDASTAAGHVSGKAGYPLAAAADGRTSAI